MYKFRKYSGIMQVFLATTQRLCHTFRLLLYVTLTPSRRPNSISSPQAFQKVILARPKILGISQFQSHSTGQAKGKENSSHKKKVAEPPSTTVKQVSYSKCLFIVTPHCLMQSYDRFHPSANLCNVCNYLEIRNIRLLTFSGNSTNPCKVCKDLRTPKRRPN